MSMKEFTPWNWFERRDLASKKGDYSLLNNFDSNYLKYNVYEDCYCKQVR